MKYRELEYSRTFNLGNYESEHITLKVDLDETEDLHESFKELKFSVFRLQKESQGIKETKQVVESDERLEPLKQSFSKNLRQLLIFEEKQNYAIIKPRNFLGSNNFAKVASVVRNLGGEYVSAGKDSHFKISKK
jgi:hypothetical protein